MRRSSSSLASPAKYDTTRSAHGLQTSLSLTLHPAPCTLHPNHNRTPTPNPKPGPNQVRGLPLRHAFKRADARPRSLLRPSESRPTPGWHPPRWQPLTEPFNRTFLTLTLTLALTLTLSLSRTLSLTLLTLTLLTLTLLP